MKRKTKIFLVDCICLMLLVGCIGQTEPVEVEPAEIVEAEATAEEEMLLEDDKEPEEKKEHVYEQNEAYKMFYGTWEYSSVVSQHRSLGGDEGYEELLGTQVTYLPEKYECAKDTVSNPNYLMSIYPLDDEHYCPFYEEQRVYIGDLLSDAQYFVWVQIVDKPTDIEKHENIYLGSEFVLKDDNTIYSFDMDCIYELKRVSYIEDYDPYNTISDRERF